REIDSVHQEPFIVSSTVNSAYRFNLTLSQNQNQRHRFVINSFTPGTVSYPADGDEICIDTAMVADINGIWQRNEDNRRCLLTIKSVPYQWSLVVGPNPLKVSENPNMCFSMQSITPVIGSAIEAEITIYDGVGNIVSEETIEPSTDSLQYFWPATNRSNRKVGPGTYMAVVRIKQRGDTVFEDRVMVGVKK
ncbi:MAG: hypothetical protein ACOCW2_04455, partial [Chitinivibrionales bacterium]